MFFLTEASESDSRYPMDKEDFIILDTDTMNLARILPKPAYILYYERAW